MICVLILGGMKQKLCLFSISNNIFIITVEVNETSMVVAVNLDKESYVTEDGTMSNIHPYAFFFKVQTHD